MNDNNDNVDDSSGYTTIVNWLRSLPAGAELTWGDNHTTTADIHSSWVDVAVEGVELGYSWLWTIEAPGDHDDSGSDNHDPTVIAVPYDRTVWAVWSPADMWYLAEPAFAVELGGTPSPDQAYELDQAAEACSGTLSEFTGWTVDTINAALNNWCRDHAGRSDLRFRYNPEYVPGADRIAHASEIARQIETGEIDTHDLGNGIHVTGDVFDFLAADPDRAADVIDQLTAVREQLNERS